MEASTSSATKVFSIDTTFLSVVEFCYHVELATILSNPF